MLGTARCLLRPPEHSDRAFVANLYQDAEVRAYLGGAMEPGAALAAAQQLLQPKADVHLWVARLASEPLSCGVLILSPHIDRGETEISYMFAQQAWGRGLASECVAAILRHAHGALGIPTILAETQRANQASQRLLKRCRMRQIASLERFGVAQLVYASSASRQTAG